MTAEAERESPELVQLRVEAAADAPAAPAGEGAQPGHAAPAQTANTLAEWRGALDFVVPFLTSAVPSLEKVYTPDRLDQLATAINAVAVKYDFRVWAFFERYKEEITLIMIATPILRDTARELRAARDAKTAPAAKGAAAAAPAARAPAPPPGDILRPNTGSADDE